MRNFGEDYSMEEHPQADFSPAPPPAGTQAGAVSVQAPRGFETGQKKATGFRALYFHYCYLLGCSPKSRTARPRPGASCAAGGFDPGAGAYR